MLVYGIVSLCIQYIIGPLNNALESLIQPVYKLKLEEETRQHCEVQNIIGCSIIKLK